MTATIFIIPDQYAQFLAGNSLYPWLGVRFNEATLPKGSAIAAYLVGNPVTSLLNPDTVLTNQAIFKSAYGWAVKVLQGDQEAVPPSGLF